MSSRIMYIERKDGVGAGEARIGRVTFTRTGKSLYYRGRRFQTLGGRGFKANYSDVETGEEYWISGPKRRGGDSLYGATVHIDDCVREEYWTTIRNQASRSGGGTIDCGGKYAR